MTYRPILTTFRGGAPHWVGDGFLTLGMLPHGTRAGQTNPFLLSGYNPPHYFPPADRPKGVGTHPHRGFETVTIVFQGGLPFQDNSFDVVWSQNVTMNVPDKQAMFSEAFRVLHPGGVYVLSHIGEGNGEAIEYPLPWAMKPETSFALPPAEFLKLLADVGFENVTDHAKHAPPSPPPAGQPEDLHAMGDDMPERRANSGRALADGRLVPILVTALRR